MEINPTNVETFKVCWSNHNESVSAMLQNFFNDDTYADCSLAADGTEILAHKLILSVCSPFLSSMLRKHREKHPIILLRDANKEDLYSIVEYMYKGQVEVPQCRLQAFLQLAQSLEVVGLRAKDIEEEEESSPKRCLKRTRTESSGEHKTKKIFSNLESEIVQEEEYLSETSDQENIKENEEGGYLFVDCCKNENDEIPNVVIKREDDQLASLDEDNLVLIPETVEPPKSHTRSKASKRTKNEMNLPALMARARAIPSENFDICCETCNGIYKTHTSFISHLRYDCNQIHSCATCNRIFKNKRHLLDHVRDDCGRVHVCAGCHRTFKQKVNLTTHQKHYCKPKNDLTIH